MNENNSKKILDSTPKPNKNNNNIYKDIKKLNLQIDSINDNILKYQHYFHLLKQEAINRSEAEKDQFLFLKNCSNQEEFSPKKEENLAQKKIYNDIIKICGKVYNDKSSDTKNNNSIDVNKITNYYLPNFKKMHSPKINRIKESQSLDLKDKNRENSNTERKLIQNEYSLFTKRISQPKSIIYRTRVNYGNYASNTVTINHPQVYVLKSNNQNSFSKKRLPPIRVNAPFKAKDMRSFIADYNENNVFSYKNKKDRNAVLFEGIKMAEIHKFGNIKLYN